MATSIVAIIRSAAPAFRNRHDQLAFAVLAAVLNDGFRLVAVGDAAQLEGLQPDAPDASVAGWNNSSEQYSFAYLADEEATASPPPPAAAAAAAAGAQQQQPAKLLLKALVLGDTLLVTLATDTAAAEPKVLELSVDEYVISSSSSSGSGSAGGAAKALKNLDQLSQTVTSALTHLLGRPAAAAAAAAAGGSSNPGSSKKQKTEGQRGTAATGEQQQQQPDPDYDPLRIGPPRRPIRLGEDDVMPLLGGGPGILGGDPQWIGGGGPGLVGGPGGGMHVGPGHPFFADRMRHPDLMPGRGLGGISTGGGRGGGGQPGIRWDPINPEGLQGWSPDDFQRSGSFGGPGRGGRSAPHHPDIDPDIGPPPPGRGVDWDNMFG